MVRSHRFTTFASANLSSPESRNSTSSLRVAAFVAIAAGIVAGLEVAAPSLPIGLIVAALALWVAGRRSEAQRQSTGA
jgi:F0F1-type ATP synthase membrane subunit c/vacuolar-type H+-ATPase subunit K